MHDDAKKMAAGADASRILTRNGRFSRKMNGKDARLGSISCDAIDQ
jgi:hypothetical protein